MKFLLSEEERKYFKNLLSSNKQVFMNIVGKPNVNIWGSSIQPQIFIDVYDIVEKNNFFNLF